MDFGQFLYLIGFTQFIICYRFHHSFYYTTLRRMIQLIYLQNILITVIDFSSTYVFLPKAFRYKLLISKFS